MTKHPDIFAALAAPFEAAELKQRKGQGNELLFYVTAPTAMNRLDNVLGPENWDEVTTPIAGSPNYLCRLTVRLPDGTIATKSGLGAPGSAQAKADPGKAAASDAFKRAAVKFGVARYLYKDGVPAFAQRFGLTGPNVPAALGTPAPRHGNVTETSPSPAPAERVGSRAERLAKHCSERGLLGQARALARSMFGCEDLATLTDGPALEVWNILKASHAVPPDQLKTPAPAPATAPPLGTENGATVQFGWPTHAAALYAWAKNIEQVFHFSCLRLLDDHAHKKGWPRAYKDWHDFMIEEGARLVANRVRALPGYDGQFEMRLPDLGRLKTDLLGKATALLRHLGNKEPTLADLKAALRAQSENLPPGTAGGELLDDVDTCTQIPLLEAVLAAVNRDLADAEAF